METFNARDTLRLLGLGNEILADDALGIYVAREVRRRFGGAIEVAASSDAGFNLLDLLLGVSHLLLVDTIRTGQALPGTLHHFGEEDARFAAGASPHGAGIFEVLAAARALGLQAPRKVEILAVEASDCATVGGAMHPAVCAAIPRIADWVGRILENVRLERAHA